MEFNELRSTDNNSWRSENGLILLAAYILALAAGFWLIDHTPYASTYFAAHSEVAENENRTADRIESVDLVTAPVRILFGVLGLGFLFLPANGTMKPNGILLTILLLYVGYLGISSLWSANPGVTAQKYLVLCCFGLAAAGLARQLTLTQLAIVFSSVCLIYIFGGALVEMALGTFAPHKQIYRFVGTSHPNSMAVFGSFCCFVAVVYFGQRPSMNHWLILLFLVGFVTLLMTKSRTTLAGFAIAIVATRFIILQGHSRILAISATMLLLVAIGSTLALSRNNVRSAAAESMAMGRTSDVSTLTGRLPLWEELIDSIQERPLLGYGYLAFWDKDKIEYLSDLLKWEIPHGHNMYLDVLLDGGMVGLLLFLSAMILALLIAGWRCMRYADREIALVFGFIFFALVHGFAESLFKLPTFLLFMLLTLILRMAMTSSGTPNPLNPSSDDSRLTAELTG